MPYRRAPPVLRPTRTIEERCIISTTPSESRKPHYVGDPTLFRVMRRPKWIAALVLALTIAGAFAWLGQWQMDLAITPEDPDAVSVEEALPLTDYTLPGESVTDIAGGAVTETSGEFVAGDFGVVETRMNQGELGVWVTGHLVTPEGHLPVAVGWADSRESAEASIRLLDASHVEQAESGAVTGRYMPPEAAAVPPANVDPQIQNSMVPGYQVNRWQDFDGASYAGFLVLHPDQTENLDTAALQQVGLNPIDSFPPLPQETVNWLNVFYAIEWIVFGGFAIFFWYRLARDSWEKEHELKLLEASQQTAAVANNETQPAH